MKEILLKDYGIDNLKPGDLIRLSSDALLLCTNLAVFSQNINTHEIVVLMEIIYYFNHVSFTVAYKDFIGEISLTDIDYILLDEEE